MKERIIQNYKILSKIGEGGMGSVFLAEHIHLNRKAALKFIHRDISSNSTLIERFKNEARVQGKISHPNIVETYDFIQDRKNFVIVMEYVEGITLKEYIKQKGKLDEVEALTIFKEIIKGIEHAHSKGIIHRDIKPSNIIIGNGNRIKVMDFGIAKLAGDNQITKTGEKIGTPYYMSPEQVIGNLEIDIRSDIYTLGVNLFLMLTGQMPYDTTQGDFTLELQIVKTPFPNIAKIVPSISKNTVDIISKLTKKEAGERYQNCEECLRDVQNSIDKLKASELKKETPGITEKVSALIETIKSKKIKTDRVKTFAGEIIGKKYFYPVLISAVVVLILSGFFILKNGVKDDTKDNPLNTEVHNINTDAVSTETEKIDIAIANQILGEYLASLYNKKADINGNGNVKIINEFQFEASDEVKSIESFDIEKYNPFDSKEFSKSDVNLKFSGLTDSKLESSLYISSYSVSDENWEIDALLKADVTNKPLLLKSIVYNNIKEIKNISNTKTNTNIKTKRKGNEGHTSRGTNNNNSQPKPPPEVQFK